MCELGEVLGIVSVHLLERLADLPVQANALGRRQLRVERVPDQPVREPEAPDRAGHLRDEPGRPGLVEQLDQRVPIAAGDPLERADAELTADHGSRLQQLDSFVPERLQATVNRLPHGVGQRQAAVRALCPGVELPLRGQQAGHLAGEERIALSRRVQRPHKVGRWSRTDLARRRSGRPAPRPFPPAPRADL